MAAALAFGRGAFMMGGSSRRERIMTHDLSRRHFIAGAIASGGLAGLPAAAAGPAASATLFREVLLVDGSGAPPRPANVLVVGDRIARITQPRRGGGGGGGPEAAGG